MTISKGDRLPSAQVIRQSGDQIETFDIAEFAKGKKIVVFGLPGAYTSVCSSAHLPSFIRTADAFREKGFDAIVCVAVNDIRVMNHWGQSSGAYDAGLMMVADWDSEFTKKLGLEFSVPAVGFKDRMTRCSMIVDDGVVTELQFEEDHSVCNLTAGETLLELV
ncbi:MAG: peroxiredoxin [Boseongicola sp.]|nr:peroxiredoxin [Boseongicola sp.]MDD9977849.1 peroxiredoxin [Boseongicola sp.]